MEQDRRGDRRSSVDPAQWNRRQYAESHIRAKISKTENTATAPAYKNAVRLFPSVGEPPILIVFSKRPFQSKTVQGKSDL